ncbi:Uncharacterised protein [Vibrio cholerae]|nr:Uncharacterised protein [Vibrio cholerae]CSD14401.1 Uncharacterised protein [Vibrio cholerae]
MNVGSVTDNSTWRSIFIRQQTAFYVLFYSVCWVLAFFELAKGTLVWQPSINIERQSIPLLIIPFCQISSNTLASRRF